MKGKRYTNEQIISFLKEHEAGAKTGDLVREHGFSEQSFYRWKSKYGSFMGMQVRIKKRNQLTRPRIPLEVPMRANQRWSLDFVHDQDAQAKLKMWRQSATPSRCCGLRGQGLRALAPEPVAQQPKADS